MSEERINGMIWGFCIGFGICGAISISPWMIMPSILAGIASWLFAKHPEWRG